MAVHTEASVAQRVEIDACWNRIGVHGDHSCQALVQHVHCRNCPVYAAAAAELLDAPLPDDHLSFWTPLVAQVPASPKDTEVVSLVIFRAGTELLALPTGIFKEVAEHRAIHSIPHRRDGVILGLTNIRGELVICASLIHLLGLEPAPKKKGDKEHALDERMLVIEHKGSHTAFPVDEIHEVGRFHATDFGDVPSTLTKAASTYIKAIFPWREKSVGLLDEQLLLFTINRSLTLATT